MTASHGRKIWATTLSMFISHR